MEKVTPLVVRDALMDCFYEAHCADTGLNEDKLSGQQYCLSLVKKIFDEQKVDFDNPTKEGIEKVVMALGEFAKNFRSQDIIKAHQKKIIDLLSRIEE